MNQVQWSSWIDGLLEAVWVVDPTDLTVLAVNPAATALQQLPAEALLGQSVLDLSPNLEDRLFWEDVGQGNTDGLHSETWLRRADGSQARVERRISPLVLSPQQRVWLVAMQDHSRHHEDQQRLETLLAELRATLDSSADGILVTDLEGRIRAYNQRFAHQWELPTDLMAHQDDEAIHAWMARAMPVPEPYLQRLAQIQRAPMLEGSDVLVLRSGKVLERLTRPQLVRGRPNGRVFAFRDITERTAQEAQLQLASKVFDSSLESIIVTDPAYRILVCNPAAQRLTGYSADRLNGQGIDALLQTVHPQHWDTDLLAQLDTRGYWEGEVVLRRQDDYLLALQVSWVVLRNEQGQALNTVLFAKDLSEKLAAQQRIEQLAYTDALTGLPNRLMLSERVQYALQMAQRTGKGFAMLFLDLDRFKAINDSLGHRFGDLVLVEVAQRLRSCLRQTDTLSRLGGDEFVVHLHEADAVGAELTAQRIQKVLDKPIGVEDMFFSLSCSMGIALYPQDGTSLDELIQNADTAMYRVKERGRGAFRFYQPEMNADLLARIKMDHAMREGLERDEFVLHYQPRVTLDGEHLRACEALIRWRPPGQGLVPPGTFIGVAEETGFIVPLGNWVLNEAVRQAAQWNAQGQPCQVAVNVSALQFQQAQFVTLVANALQRHGLTPDLLELELTESILIHDAEEALERLQALSALGVTLSLDDFGTGYSSLAYLKRFPLHKLKIDHSFIRSLHQGGSDLAIVAAIVQMGHALGLEVVAEGVELPAQRHTLVELGCDQYQGYLTAPGLAADDFSRWRQGRTPTTA